MGRALNNDDDAAKLVLPFIPKPKATLPTISFNTKTSSFIQLKINQTMRFLKTSKQNKS